MKVKCPHCGAVAQAPGEFTGRRVQCPKCKKVLVAIPDMDAGSSSAEKTLPQSKQPESQESPKPKGNFFTRSWTKSPVAFRTAFLATFGVIAALWAAWYIFGVARYFTTPKLKEAAYTPPATTTPASPEKRPTGAKEAVVRAVAQPIDVPYLAAAIRFIAYMEGLYQVQNARIIAAKEYAAFTSSTRYAAVLSVCQKTLADLETRVASLQVPPDTDLRRTQEYIMEAIAAERDFERSLTMFAKSKRPESRVEAITEEAERTVDLYSRAMMQAIFVLTESHPDLLKALTRVDGPQKK